MKKPQYSPELLISLCRETKDIGDHAQLIKLYEDLHAQGDINFDERIINEISASRQYFRFVNAHKTMDALCEFCLRLQKLQEKGYAVVTRKLKDRIDYQRTLISQNYQF